MSVKSNLGDNLSQAEAPRDNFNFILIMSGF